MVLNNEKVKEIKGKIQNNERIKRTEVIHYCRDINLRRANLDYVYNHVELLEHARCCDIEYFIEKYVDIKLFDHQKEIVKLYKENRFSIIMSSRQTGSTTILMILFLHYLLFNNEKNILLVSNKSMTNTEHIKIIKRYYKKLPFFLQKGVVNWNQMSINFDNGSRVIVSSSREVAIGCNIHVLLVNEFARMPDSTTKSITRNLIPAISALKDSKIIITSTPCGYNSFQKMVQDSEREENDPLKNAYKTLRIHWSEVPNRNEEWKQQQIRLIGGEEAFNQEYELKFISSKKSKRKI